jgi:hypothetical protein
MRVLRVLVLHVRREIGLWIAFEQVGEVERHRHPQARRRLPRQVAPRLRDDPYEQHRLHHEHGTEKRHRAEGDAPIEAAVPLHRVRG